MGELIGLGVRAQVDAEDVALRMRGDANLGAAEVTGALRFATNYFGTGSVFVVSPEEVWGDGEVTANEQILVRRGLAPAHQEFVIYRACAEHWFAREAWTFDSSARRHAACDAVAAALQAPGPAFEDAVADLGEDFAALAQDFSATQTAMALRLGEVVGRGVRVQRPGLVRVRGTWKHVARVRRVVLTDAVDRFAFVAA